MRKNVFIIEDDEDDFTRLYELLSPKGFTILPNDDDFINMQKSMNRFSYSAYSGNISAFVIDYLKEHYKEIDLILCDIKFEGLNDEGGKECIEDVRACSEFSPFYWAYMVPVVVVTNYSSNQLPNLTSAKVNRVYLKENIFTTQTDEFRHDLDSLIKQFRNHFSPKEYPQGIEKRIIDFKRRHPRNTAYIITDYLLKNFAEKAKTVLDHHNMYGKITIAPGGENRGKAWDNIEIYMNGCDFGICIYSDDSTLDSDGNKRDKMNANVSFEVGYMLGLQKSVCFLKHDSLSKQPSDFSGDNYLAFKDEDSLEHVLIEWLKNREFIEEEIQ